MKGERNGMGRLPLFFHLLAKVVVALSDNIAIGVTGEFMRKRPRHVKCKYLSCVNLYFITQLSAVYRREGCAEYVEPKADISN